VNFIYFAWTFARL